MYFLKKSPRGDTITVVQNMYRRKLISTIKCHIDDIFMIIFFYYLLNIFDHLDNHFGV